MVYRYISVATRALLSNCSLLSPWRHTRAPDLHAAPLLRQSQRSTPVAVAAETILPTTLTLGDAHINPLRVVGKAVRRKPVAQSLVPRNRVKPARVNHLKDGQEERPSRRVTAVPNSANQVNPSRRKLKARPSIAPKTAQVTYTTLPPFPAARADLSQADRAEEERSAVHLCLAVGSVHQAPPPDAVFDAKQVAQLVSQNLQPQRVSGVRVKGGGVVCGRGGQRASRGQ